MSDSEISSSLVNSQADGRYTVVARRYRPKSFDDLVGQGNVSQALSTAIANNRVGHAYLFTGARGVGKTSTARIFAKALNNPGGASAQPDLNSDVAQAIDSGEDIDVIEIDGASNRGIEEIRQLRSNISVRPSRSRYKIYIIDEVHMLTPAAFNALLKTLEEPPEHVKFIFCTTDPEKIPITVLSRCQRFDFSPVRSDEILTRLKLICDTEGATASDAALGLIAKRASGSMRDSQSLLEQILSFSGGTIDLEQVHSVLGTADDGLLIEMLDHVVDRDAAACLQIIERASIEGVDAGQLAEQLMGFLRDVMTLATGAPASLLRTADPANAEKLTELANRWGLKTLLAAIQLLDDVLIKMRQSIHDRVLLEVAIVEMCYLQNLETLAGLVESLATGTPVAPEKKNIAATESHRSTLRDATGDASLSVESDDVRAPNVLASEASVDRVKVDETEMEGRVDDSSRADELADAPEPASAQIQADSPTDARDDAELLGNRQSSQIESNKEDASVRETKANADGDGVEGRNPAPFSEAPNDSQRPGDSQENAAASGGSDFSPPQQHAEFQTPPAVGEQRSATPDTATLDTATLDTATPDTATPDTATPDTATLDTATLKSLANVATTHNGSGTDTSTPNPSGPKPDRETSQGLPPAVKIGTDASSNSPTDLLEFWKVTVGGINELYADYAKMAGRVTEKNDSTWTISFAVGYEEAVSQCKEREAYRMLSNVVGEKIGRTMAFDFVIANDLVAPLVPSRAKAAAISTGQLIRDASQLSIIKAFQETFACSITRVDPPVESTPPPASEESTVEPTSSSSG
jgi:DNA polymerase-3 subunit gamma/tau